MLIDLMRSYGSIKILHSYALKMNPLQDLSFQTVSFSGTFVATTSAKFFSEFHAPLQEPSFLIVFFSDNWCRQAFFFQSLFRFHFVTIKGITKSLTRSWAIPSLVIASVLACKHQLEQTHDANSFLMFSFKEWHTWPYPFYTWTEL